jgi:hypothetical protein
VDEVLGDLIKGIIGNRSTVSLAESIVYQEGGPLSYPGQADTLLWIEFGFAVEYHTRIGDPYTKA